MSTIETILNTYKNIAVIGASASSDKPSHRVYKYLKEVGYNVFPVNPNIDEILGEKCYAAISDIPEKIEVVDIFRPSGDVFPFVEEAINIGAKAIWMQEGIIDNEAAKKAESAGLMVVMDKCMFKEHVRLNRED